MPWRGSCEDCAHWVFDDKGFGHCGLYSAACAQSISDKGEPKNFLDREVEEDEDDQ